MFRRTKILLVSVLAVLFFGMSVVFAACGDNGADASQVTVTYRYENGQADLVQTVPQGSKAAKPADPVKDGFTFEGWFTDGASVSFSFDTAVTENLVLTAHWKSNQPSTEVVVTFKYENGQSDQPVTLAKGALAQKPATPAKDGYVFVGWFADGASEEFDFSKPITENIVLTAHWNVSQPTGNVTVTYRFDNGKKDVVRPIKAGDKAFRVKSPVKEGFTFVGWFAEGASEEYDFDAPVMQNLVLVAHWSEGGDAQTVRITWVEDDAYEYLFDEGTAPNEVDHGTTVRFRVRFSPYYVGEATVAAGRTELTADDDGYYSFVADGSLSVKITGLESDITKIKGVGTTRNPFIISTASQLKTVTDAINNPSDTTYNSSVIQLNADLDLNGIAIDPIGSQVNVNHFAGLFDGNGHTISNFTLRETEGVVGFFGYLVEGEVKNLNLKNVSIDLETLEERNYIIGGIVAYNMGGDVIGCSAEGNFNINFTYEKPVSYVGGIVGFMQGYSTDHSGTVSYSTSKVNINSIGEQGLYGVGGIVGAMYGTARSAPAYVNNCVYQGNITGLAKLCGGICGFMRDNTSIANCFTSGNIHAESVDTLAAAGGLVGLAENESAVTFSYSTAKTTNLGSDVDQDTLVVGSAIGAARKSGVAGAAGVDGRQVLQYRVFGKDDAVSVNGKTFDLSKFADVKELLGWTDSDWTFENGIPVVKTTGAEQINYTVRFDFSGRSITREGADGKPLTQTSDDIVSDSYIPVNWVYKGSGMNNFTADNKEISFGYFLDKECTQRVPSSMLLTQNMTIYVGFADYSSVAGEYFAVVGDQQIRLVFDDNGKMTMYHDGMIDNIMYVFDGHKILLTRAYFAHLAYQAQNGFSLYADYYAEMEDGKLRIYDNLFFSPEMNMEIIANKHNNAMGQWYNRQNRVYTFYADGTGTIEGTGAVQKFTYTCLGNIVTLQLGGQIITATISEDLTKMQTSDGIALSVNRFDEYLGDWEGVYGTDDAISFDGIGKVTFKGKTYDYTVNPADQVLTFEGYTANFNQDGLLVLKGADGTETVMGRGGSYIGQWMETYLKYSMALYGIGKDGYGYGFDSNGVRFTYTAEMTSNGDGTESYFLRMFYGTMSYGYGGILESKDGKSEFLACAIFTPESGFLVDDYNMCFVDNFEGKWNGPSGLSFSFNGLGYYDIYQKLSDGSEWIAKGEVVVTENGVSKTVAYQYNKEAATATFVYSNVTYKATFAKDGISVQADSAPAVIYKAPDAFGQYSYYGNGVKVSFNGKSNVGIGKVTIGGTEYDYTIENGTANITLNGELQYTVAEDENHEYLLMTSVKDASVQKLGYYSKMIGKTYIFGNNKELAIVNDISLNKTAVVKLGDLEMDAMFTDESTMVLYIDGEVYAYLTYQNENNAGLFDEKLSFIGIATIADEWLGEYTAENGNVLVFDGKSNASNYIYATVEMTVVSSAEGEQIRDSFIYVYKIENGVLTIYELEKGEEDNLIAKYTVTKEKSEGAVAYTSESGKVIYVTEA